MLRISSTRPQLCTHQTGDSGEMGVAPGKETQASTVLTGSSTAFQASTHLRLLHAFDGLPGCFCSPCPDLQQPSRRQSWPTSSHDHSQKSCVLIETFYYVLKNFYKGNKFQVLRFKSIMILVLLEKVSGRGASQTAGDNVQHFLLSGR